jgi:superfamily I DNA/RNA helicase
MVGDPRQGTYSTNSTRKLKKYRKSQIVNFFEDIPAEIQKDSTSLTINYRCVPQICDLSNDLFPGLPSTTSGNTNTTGHDGVFLVKPRDVDKYLKMYSPVMQLRDSIKTNVNAGHKVMNFGESKGLSFERVLIYPTKPFCNWMKDHTSELAQTSRSKLYVALTRARQSVAIVFDYKGLENMEGVSPFVPAIAE